MRLITRTAVAAALMTAAFVVPSSAVAAPHTGGLDLTATPEQPAETAPPAVGAVEIPAGMRTTNGVRAKRYKGKNADGRTAYFARVPLKAPVEVQRAVIAANKIVGKPYKWGGGHAKVEDSGYDCSGTVSYSLIGAGLLKTPLSSYEFDDVWKVAERGKGQWISVYGNRSHVYAVIAGLRLDTSAAGDRSGSRRLKGPQWRPDNRTDAKRFTLVHPTGL